VAARGELRLTLGTSFTAIETAHDDVEDVVGRGPTEVIHDQDILFSESRLEAELGILDGLAVGAILPLRVVATGITFRERGSGAEVSLAGENIHHRDETLTGLGDPWLVAHAGRALGAWQLDGRLGVTLPLGRTEEDPFRLGDMGLAHQHVKMGTGTVNLVAQLELARAIGRARLSAWALTRQTFTENAKAYRAGDRYAGGLAARVGLGRWVVGGGVEAQGETAETWAGVEPTDDGNRGRLDLLVGAEAAVRVGERAVLALSAKVPFHTDVVGGQLSYPVVLGLSLTTRIAVWGGPAPPARAHAHAHAHAPEPEPAALVPEPGAITVFDYWASWCEPCKDLDARLARIPGIVVKRIDVSDAHLDFDLPHLKVFGRNGALVFERSGTPAELAAAVEALAR
jgi:thiol-disulfide isomerase/thioredoxin